MEPLIEAFEERLREIEIYLDLLDAVEKQTRLGPSKLLGGAAKVSAEQQKILYSAVYLQLYSLVESTATRCIEAVCGAADGKGWRPGDLSEFIQREWVRSVARTHEDLGYDARLTSALEMFGALAGAAPVSRFKVSGAGGNWDDGQIEKMFTRLGFAPRLSEPVKAAVKRHVRDEKGPLALIKHLRNKLAHGNLSFVECGEGATVSDLRSLKDATAAYLREVVESFAAAIAAHEYLRPEVRPPARADA